jgi:hypothetical protein
MTRCPFAVHAALILAATAAALPGAAQNLVVNPNFDTDTTSWTGPGVWDTLDVDASPTSGSATYINASAGTAGFAFASQCITVDPAAVGYDLAARTYVPSGQAGSGVARVDVVWFTDALCTDYLTYSEFPPPGLFDTWEQAGGPSFRPSTALSARVSAVNQKYGVGSFQVFVDAVSLQPNLSSMIFGDGFDSGSQAAWSASFPGPG